jgi:hypothetical protein
VKNPRTQESKRIPIEFMSLPGIKRIITGGEFIKSPLIDRLNISLIIKID